MKDYPEKIMSLFLRISRAVKKSMVIKCRNGRTINPLQMHALLIISRKEEISMKEFAKSLSISSPSATAFAGRLVSNNWVKRISDPKNRKLVKLCLTDYGKKVIENKKEERKELAKQLIKSIPVEDQKDLVRILDNILSNLKK